MLNLTPLAPGEPGVTVHIVLNDFGAVGRAYVETDETEADEASLIGKAAQEFLERVTGQL